MVFIWGNSHKYYVSIELIKPCIFRTYCMKIHTRNTGITPRKHMWYTVISSSLFMSKLVSMVNKEKVFLYVSNQKGVY